MDDDVKSQLIELRNQLIDVDADFVEVVLDRFLADGPLKDIPLLGIAIKVGKIGQTLRDAIFYAKIYKFVRALNGLPEREVLEYLERLRADAKQRRKAAEVVVLVLERLNDLEKPEMVAKMFIAYVRGEIDLNQFRRLSTAIEIGYVDDLMTLVTAEAGKPAPTRAFMTSLAPTGLTELAPTVLVFGSENSDLSTRITELGRVFVKIMNSHI